MKKNTVVIIVVALVILVAAGALIYASIKLNKDNKEADKHLVTLSYSELMEKIENKDSFIMVVTQTGCTHCEAYKPVLKDVLVEYDLYAYEVNTAELSEEEKAKFKDIANTSGTPTTVFINDGEETTTANRLVGNRPRSDIVNRLKALGYIKE